MRVLDRILRAFRRGNRPADEVRALQAPADLEAVLDTVDEPWTPAGLQLVRDRLDAAASGEWATSALAAFDAAPERFVHLVLIWKVEQARTRRAVLAAAADLEHRTGAESVEEALAQLGLTEAEWLATTNLAVNPGPPTGPPPPPGGTT